MSTHDQNTAEVLKRISRMKFARLNEWPGDICVLVSGYFHEDDFEEFNCFTEALSSVVECTLQDALPDDYKGNDTLLIATQVFNAVLAKAASDMDDDEGEEDEDDERD